MTNKEKEKLQDEIVDSLPEPSHGLIKLAPRTGKSRIAVRNLKNEKPESILWVTPNTKLRDEDIPNEFAKWNAKRLLKKATIICYGSLSNMRGHFDKIILDEYQDVTEANAEPLLRKQLTYGTIMGLSGTHPKHIEKLNIYRKLGLNTIADMSIDEAIDKDIIADYQINVIEVNLNNKDKNIEAGNKDKKWMQTELDRYNYLDDTANKAIWQRRKDAMFRVLARMRAIYNSPSKHEVAEWLIDNVEGRKLIFAGSIKQAEELSPYTYHSKTDNKDLQAFIREENGILACVNAGGVGFTYRNVDNFIIIQADSDKKGLTTQKITRALLQQGSDYKASIYIISLAETKDEIWVEKTLSRFNVHKIEYIKFINLKNGTV